MTYTAIAYGGGVQSTAMVVLAVQGKLPADVALFCNVGDDSEHPASLVYVREVAQPWAAAHDFPVHELHRVRRNGQPETLMEMLHRPETRSVPIPVRMADGAPGTRNCTETFKLKVMARWLRERGHGKTLGPADIAIGISVDEIERAGKGRNDKVCTRTYPLLDLGLTRADCMQIIADAGLRVPPKSSCYFCPFHRPQTFAEMRRDEPELFAKAQDLEDHLNGVRDRIGKDHVYLTRFGKRLEDAVAVAQDTLPGMSVSEMNGEHGCDEGVCFV